MNTLTLNDGTVLEDTQAIESTGMLFIYSYCGHTIKELCDLLFPAENISSIEANFPGGTKTYNGYNRLVAVRDEGNNLLTAVLAKDGAE